MPSHRNLGKEVEIIPLTAIATGTTDVYTDIIDCQGCEGVLFLIKLGTANAANGIKALQSADDSAMGGSDAAQDLEGTANVASFTDFAAELYQPRHRYVRASIERGGATTTVNGYAIKIKSHAQPTVNDIATVQSYTFNRSPAVGTP